jgi:S-methyl-5-thioribose-1-phosphate isomerase
MNVRGAPALGVAAAYALAQAAHEFNGGDVQQHLQSSAETISATRPTAVNARNSLERVLAACRLHSADDCKRIAVETAEAIAAQSIEACKQIGFLGSALIENGDAVLTHCNAGALACVDYGTALAPLRFAHYDKKGIFVYVDETRPRLQGALTAWELRNEGISHAVIADNARGHFMRSGAIKKVVVGADRIARNGDFANKIGTYETAVLAKENGIPLYVAAPLSTVDSRCETGAQIPIEERDASEVLFACGANSLNRRQRLRLFAEGTEAKNPAFDVTPAKYVSAFITEAGVLKPHEIAMRF